jgi:hypothetical protein
VGVFSLARYPCRVEDVGFRVPGDLVRHGEGVVCLQLRARYNILASRGVVQGYLAHSKKNSRGTLQQPYA